MDRKRLLKNPLLWIVAVVLLYFVFSQIFDSDRGYTQVPTSQAVQQLKAGTVKEANLEDKEQQLKLQLGQKIDVDGQQVDQIITQYPAQAGDEIYNALLEAKQGTEPIKFNTTVTQDSFFTQILFYIIPFGTARRLKPA